MFWGVYLVSGPFWVVLCFLSTMRWVTWLHCILPTTHGPRNNDHGLKSWAKVNPSSFWVVYVSYFVTRTKGDQNSGHWMDHIVLLHISAEETALVIEGWQGRIGECYIPKQLAVSGVSSDQEWGDEIKKIYQMWRALSQTLGLGFCHQACCHVVQLSQLWEWDACGSGFKFQFCHLVGWPWTSCLNSVLAQVPQEWTLGLECWDCIWEVTPRCRSEGRRK
jgi:hypothetical protein